MPSVLPRFLLGEVALAEGEINASPRRARGAPHSIRQSRSAIQAAESLGRMYARAFEYESAAAVFARNRDRAVAAGDPINEVRFASLLANAQIDAGNFGAAEEALAGAIRASETVADPLTVARMFWSQSRLHSHQQDSANAARYAQRALELLEASDQTTTSRAAISCWRTSSSSAATTSCAADLLDRAAPTIAASGRKFELASFRIEQARVLLKANRREEAGAIAMQASAEMAGQSAVDSGRSYALLASVFAELADEERAIELYELAIESLNATPNRWLVEAYSKLAELHEKRGDQEAMIEALKRGMRSSVRPTGCSPSAEAPPPSPAASEGAAASRRPERHDGGGPAGRVRTADDAAAREPGDARRLLGDAHPASLAAGVSWYVAHDLIGHPTPFFAPIAALIVLAAATTNRTRRVIELSLGVCVGIGIGDLLVSQIGTGSWQVALVVLMAMSAATLLGGGPFFVGEAATSGVLVSTVVGGAHGSRAVDALAGGVIGLLAVMVFPQNPLRAARREAAVFFSELGAALDDVAEALEQHDVAGGRQALARARRPRRPRSPGGPP